MELITPDLSQLDTLNAYLRGHTIKDCAFCPGNAVLWSERYHTKYAILSDLLVFVAEEEGHPSSFTFPIGTGWDFGTGLSEPDYLSQAKSVIKEVCAYFASWNAVPRMHCVTPDVHRLISDWYGCTLPYIPERGDFDYIYTVESLTTLRGQKLHGKRNHINRFLKDYPNYRYARIEDAHIEDCLTIARRWQGSRDALQPELANDHAYEYRAIETALIHRTELCMTGGVLYVNDAPAAFTLGEPLTADTFDVHFEKADDRIPGIYPMINQQFVAHELQDYTYVNREEDLGLPGLRQSKMSYVPELLYEKGTITLYKENHTNEK